MDHRRSKRDRVPFNPPIVLMRDITTLLEYRKTELSNRFDKGMSGRLCFGRVLLSTYRGV